jgi:putative sigma-54 modulation protein
MYSSIDLALDKLEKQIKKQKAKIKNHRQAGRGEERPPETGVAPAQEEAPVPNVIVKNLEYKPMDVEEAIMQMELISDSFLVFLNARTNQINVLYRRNDGDLGLIQPVG